MDSSSPSRLSRWKILLGALRELGPRQIGNLALYKIALYSGLLRRQTPAPAQPAAFSLNAPADRLFPLPESETLQRLLGEQGCARLLSEAEEALERRVRLFGGDPVPLQLRPPQPLQHWTDYERGRSQPARTDVKFIWEPARLGWGVLLGRAYRLTGDERFPAAFWRYLEEFLDENPPYLGLNWVSAQEAALRILGMLFCWQIFAVSADSTPERARRLAQAIALHAARIPPSLAYARSQNNNHLLSEAAGLYAAGTALPDHPDADGWRRLGWRLFHAGLQCQIDADGAYCQHSANYQRLMLQLALWMRLLARRQGQAFPAESVARLSAAARWLSHLLDLPSGGVPNLGPNDGAYILPLAGLGQSDYRPVVQAAYTVFVGRRFLPPGAWDEMGIWLGADQTLPQADPGPASSEALLVLRPPGGDSWAYLRAARFRGRPGHADQLHLDLWWRGLNLALDPGTYLYNASPPWDNSLASSEVHNTLVVEGSDQMQRAGRFLYLDWAQAQVIPLAAGAAPAGQSVAARQDGYRRLGVIHRRQLACLPGEGWQVDDALLPAASASPSIVRRACLHWLLPDWPWQVRQNGDLFTVQLESPRGLVWLELSARIESGTPASAPHLQLCRAGERVYGDGQVKPFWGWFSPTYAKKIPALSLRLSLEGEVPLHFESRWKLV